MTLERAVAGLAAAMVVLPAASFVAAATLEVLGRTPSDRTLARIARVTFTLSTLAGLTAAALFVCAGGTPVHVVFGHWYGIGPASAHYGFDVGVLVDATSLVYLVMTAVLAGTAAAFSLRYLEAERGAGRFFQLLMLFAAGLSLLVLAESLDSFFVGWELMGITSALLIAFYRERSGPVRHALAAFAIYRVCDVALLAALVVLHHVAGTSSLPRAFEAAVGGGSATLLGLLLVFASLGKSAQWPWSGWLPRAMEGPTPSSAIFYGALSVHAGAYLLLRTAPLWEGSLLVRGVVVAVGAVSALMATLVGRAQTDAKSSLAYASVAQVGLVYVEIGLGLHTLALIHVAGHATVRTLELLRAPSLLADHQRLEAELGASVPRSGAHYERLVPRPLRDRLYTLALQRGHLDALAIRLVARARSLVLALDRLDTRVATVLDAAPPSEARPAGRKAGDEDRAQPAEASR